MPQGHPQRCPGGGGLTCGQVAVQPLLGRAQRPLGAVLEELPGPGAQQGSEAGGYGPADAHGDVLGVRRPPQLRGTHRGRACSGLGAHGGAVLSIPPRAPSLSRDPPPCPPLGYLLGWLRGGCVLIAPGCSACNGGGTRGC